MIAVAASADGSTFAALTGDGRVRVWDNAGRLKGSLETQETFGAELLLSFNGELVTAWAGPPTEMAPLAGSDQVQIWDVASRTVWRTLNVPVIGLHFSPTKDQLAVVKDVRPAWAAMYGDRAFGYQMQRNDFPHGQLYIFDGRSSPKPIASCRHAKFSPNGRNIALLGADRENWGMHRRASINIYDSETGKLDVAQTRRFAACDCVAWAPDGATVASVSWMNSEQAPSEIVEKWKLRTEQKHVVPLRAPGDGLASSGQYHTIAFLPDGRTLVVGAAGRGLKALDASTLAPQTGVDMSKLWRVAAGQRGDLFIATDMHSVELWDAATLHPQKRLFQANARPDHRLAACGLAVWLAVVVARRRYAQTTKSTTAERTDTLLAGG